MNFTFNMANTHAILSLNIPRFMNEKKVNYIQGPKKRREIHYINFFVGINHFYIVMFVSFPYISTQQNRKHSTHIKFRFQKCFLISEIRCLMGVFVASLYHVSLFKIVVRLCVKNTIEKYYTYGLTFAIMFCI